MNAAIDATNCGYNSRSGGNTALDLPDGDLNFQPVRQDGAPVSDARKTEASLDQVREMLDQTKNNLLRTQRRIERNEQQAQSFSRQLMALWVLVIMVIVGFGLLTWYQVLLQRRP
jgi:hypothetical protein